jgi:hypothetical protein
VKNHWLRKKVAKEDLLKCVCKITYTCIDNSIGGCEELPLQLQVTWFNCIGNCIIHYVKVLDKNGNLILSKPVACMLNFDVDITFNFTNMIFRGFRAEDLLA